MTGAGGAFGPADPGLGRLSGCAARILERQGIRPDRHYDLSELGVKKRKHEDFDPGEAVRVLEQILEDPARPGSAAS